MAAVIIKEKDIKRLGKDLIKEINDFLHDEWVLTEFKEMKKVQKEFLENLAMEGDGVDIKGIYHTLISLNLDKEINEDLYFKTLAFLDIFRVFDVQHIYLDN